MTEPPKLSKYSYVWVEWEDAHYLADVVQLESVMPQAWLRYTVGYLLHNGEQVVVGATLDDDSVQGVFTIPRVLVRQMHELIWAPKNKVIDIG